MKKWYVIICLAILIASTTFLIVAIGYSNSQSSKLLSEKTTNKTLTTNINESEQEKNQNSILVNKIDSDPNQLAKDAKKQTAKFVDVIKKSEGEADSDKVKTYNVELKGITSTNLRTNRDLTSIKVPEDYAVDVSTQRGDSIPVLYSSKDRYLVVEYDAYSELVTSVKEYNKT